jgi:hypothetical protein
MPDKSSVRHIVQFELERLGGSSLEVGLTLSRGGFRGRRYLPWGSPLTRYLKSKLPHDCDVFVYEAELKVLCGYGSDKFSTTLPLPEPVARFQHEFNGNSLDWTQLRSGTMADLHRLPLRPGWRRLVAPA